MRVIAIEILTIALPNLSIFLPARRLAAFNAVTNTKKAPANAAPFIISSVESIPTNLTTATSNNNVTAIFLIIFPALSIFCADLPFTKRPKDANTPAIATISPAKPIKPCFISSGFIVPITFTVEAIINNAILIPTKPIRSPFRLKPFLSTDADADVS